MFANPFLTILRRNVRLWLGADIQRESAELPLLTLSGHCARNRSVFPSGALTAREMTIGQGFPSPNQLTKPGVRYAICRSRLVSSSTASRATIHGNRGAIRGISDKGIVVSPLANVRRVILTMQLNPILNGRAGME